MTTINTPSQAIVEALAQDTNRPGMCQQVTREWYNAPSAGDVDKDGDFDAVDGWLKEPVEARHPNDRTPRIGYPVSYVGGTNGHGHRALYLGNGLIRSTDLPFLGETGTVSINQPELRWGLRYVGWSETIDGLSIPTDADVDPERKEPRKGTKLYKALEKLRDARNEAKKKGQTEKVVQLNLVITELLKTPRGN